MHMLFGSIWAHRVGVFSILHVRVVSAPLAHHLFYTCFWRVRAAMSSVIDDYEPLEIIGNGSFGVIRKVRRRSDGILFARKELNFERMTDRDRKQIVAEVYVFPHTERLISAT